MSSSGMSPVQKQDTKAEMGPLPKRKAKPAPWMYILIRLLFKFVLNVFYGTIVVENEHYIPNEGEPVIICANHTNSLTDALLLVTSVSTEKRNFLRLTAKDTQFNRGTFSSWLVENAGTLPIKRRKEHGEQTDNREVMGKLLDSLEEGDAICLFPEGMSRFHPTMAPLKTGVARIVSDLLTRNKDNPDFAVTVLTCSLTYVHRQHFRSDVLVSFNPPLKISVSDTPSLIADPSTPENNTFDAVKSLTTFMQAQLSSNTIDAPSWDLVRAAKTAARIYVPLGTRMRLGDWVRVVARFVEGFSVIASGEGAPGAKEGVAVERKGLRKVVNWDSRGNVTKRTVVGTEDEHDRGSSDMAAKVVEELVPSKSVSDSGSITEQDREQLAKDVMAYQDRLNALGLKDDRIRQSALTTHRRVILWRLLLRFSVAFLLLFLALPGLVLWLPVFLTTAYYTRRLKQSGPIWDTIDEVAQTKLIYGLASGVVVWVTAVLVTAPRLGFGLFITVWFIPAWMWITLRWTEDLISSLRAAMALFQLLRVGQAELKHMREVRAGLHSRIQNLATTVLGLPVDPEAEFLVISGEGDDEVDDQPSRWAKHQRGRTRGGWDSAVRYFSIRRRRKRDWNETLRWFDATDFPKE